MNQKTTIVFITLFALFSCSKEVQIKNEVTTSPSQNWKTEVEKTIKLFGHRNWIVVADGAYPKQSNPAIKTITVDANQLEVVQFVNEVIKKSSHVQAYIFLDKDWGNNGFTLPKAPTTKVALSINCLWVVTS